MRKSGKFSFIIFLIIAFFFPIFFSSCVGGHSAGGGSNGSGGGSSSGGGGSGSSEQPKEPNYGSPSSMDPDDYYEGVVILTDATSEGLFYDDFTRSKKTFKELVEREIVTISQYIVFALNSLYGDATANGSGALTYYSFSIMPTNLLGKKHIEGCYGWEDSFNVNCPVCQSKIAGLDGINHSTQLNYDKAIDGGYVYNEIESEDDSQLGEFSTTELNISYKWIGKSNLNEEFLKEKIAYALMSEECNGAGFDEYIKCIDHLGFTDYDIEKIIEIIGEQIIGKDNLNKDDMLYKNHFAVNPYVENGTQENFDQFPYNEEYHYYRAYTQNIRFILDVALTTANDGVQYVDDFGEYNGNIEKLFPTMGRVNAEVFKMSDISTKVNGYWDEESKTLAGVSEEPVPVLDDPKKLVGMVFIPKLNPDIADEFKNELTEKYGPTVANSYDCNAFRVGDFNLAFKNDGERDVTVKLKFFVSINTPESQTLLGDEGNVALNDYVENFVFSNDYSSKENDSDVFISETEIFLKKGEYSLEEYLATYDVSGAIKEKHGKDLKIKDYDGVQVYSDDGKLSETSFYEEGGKFYLRTNNDLFDVIARTNEYDEEVAGTNTTFKAVSNFIQISFEYFDGDQPISPVELYLMYLSAWVG